ncbi:MAG: PH domain-containing protein [Myxococcales bacterium]|nr:PH domain-containing protein [Myxococcales bacterium]
MSDTAVPFRGLHPVSLLVNLVPRTWATLRTAWPLLLALVAGRASGQGLVDLSLISVFFLLAIGNTVVHFLTLRYRVVDGRLEMKTGLLNRQVRVIGAERIQNMEMVRNVFHRLSGMVEVRIETASGTEVEGLLSALSEAEARALIEALEEARGEAGPQQDEEVGTVVATNGPLELVWFGATGTRFGGIAVLLGLAMEALVFDPTADPEDVARTGGFLAGTGGLALLVALVSGAWLVGTVTAVVRHHAFRLTRTTAALVAEQGLLTKRRAVLRNTKVQLVTVLEPVLRRLSGFASVSIETAAAREGGDGTQRSEALVPYVAHADVQHVVGAAVELGSVDPMTAQLTPPHPLALVRATAASVTRSAIFAGLATWWFYPWGLVGWILVPLAIASARLDHRTQGWLVSDGLLVSRRGWLNRRTWLLALSKLQSTAVTQGPILRRYGLGIVQVRVAGSVVSLPAMLLEDALQLQLQLSRSRRG